MHYIYSFGQPCLTLLTSCTIVAYDNYNTIGINETLINNLFATTLKLLVIIIIIIINIL
jgi:hypothetical protein